MCKEIDVVDRFEEFRRRLVMVWTDRQSCARAAEAVNGAAAQTTRSAGDAERHGGLLPAARRTGFPGQPLFLLNGHLDHRRDGGSAAFEARPQEPLDCLGVVGFHDVEEDVL
jgi:hypothetical protein